jgi:hypothetical protein
MTSLICGGTVIINVERVEPFGHNQEVHPSEESEKDDQTGHDFSEE